MKRIVWPDIRAIEKEERESRHFARGLNFYKLFWIFFIGCFLGVVVETLWCLLTRGHYESRVGLIYGPFNLVYGFGALAMALGLYKVRGKRDSVVMVVGAAIGSVVEYICSWVQELLFGSVSWDYSAMPFNLQGRINLLYSFFWGILAIVWVKSVYPWLAKWILRIPNRVGKPLTWFLLAFMIINTVMSGCAVGRWMNRRQDLPPANHLEAYLDLHYPDERMEKIYPNMMFGDE